MYSMLLAKAEYTVTDLTVEPMRTYAFDRKKRLLGVWDAHERQVFDDVPRRILDIIWPPTKGHML